MALPEWQEQGYHFAGMLITFGFAWVGILVAFTVDSCSTKATSLLSLFAGGVLFAGGIVHLLGDALDVLRTNSSEHSQLIALSLCSFTYIILFILNVLITGYFGSKLQRHQKKSDNVRLMVDVDDADFNADVIMNSPHDEAVLFIASLKNAGLRSSAVLMCVLSVHSFLAGLAFGSQPDPAEEFKIMIPITAHKSLASMALAINFKKARIRRFNMLILLLIFSCSTPIGTLTGMVVSASVESDIWTGVCLAIASGTFIFVTLNDIIPVELMKNTELLLPKCAALCLGYLVMTLLAIWV